MARLRLQKTSFTGGEISPLLVGRTDLRAYDNGAGKLRNVFIHPTGGLSRRAGLRYVDTVAGGGRLVAFEFNTEQVYLLVFTDGQVDVYRDGAWVTSIDTPWTEAQVDQINWTQTADTLLVVHPEVSPRKITRDEDEQWSIAEWTFIEEDEDKDKDGGTVHVNRIQQPHHKFAGDDVTLTPSGTSGTVTLTASADVFQSAHVGARMRIQDKEVEVTAFTSATQVDALVKEGLVDTSATKDWEEQAFSALHGWPVAVCFHRSEAATCRTGCGCPSPPRCSTSTWVKAWTTRPSSSRSCPIRSTPSARCSRDVTSRCSPRAPNGWSPAIR